MVAESTYTIRALFLYRNLGLAISTVRMWLADLGLRSDGGSRPLNFKIPENNFWVPLTIIRIISLIHIVSHVETPSHTPGLRKALEVQESAQRKGHFALFS